LKINYLHHNQIDKSSWDACIDRSCQRIVYALSWYLDIVHAGWEALVVDDYRMVMPLTSGRKFGINYLYQPSFTQQLGIFSEKQPSPEETETILNAIPVKFRFIDISLNKGNKFGLERYQAVSYRNYELNLDKPYTELVSAYASNTRRNLKKAVQNRLTVTAELDPAELIQLFRDNRGRDFTNLKTKQYQHLQTVMETSLANQQAEMMGVFSEKGNLSAGAFFLYSYDSFIFLFSASSDYSKQNGAMFLIIDRFIEKYAGSKHVLDFEGSNLASLARFYRSFGSEEFQYTRIRKNELPWPLNRFKR
jgi:hypothetical protein